MMDGQTSCGETPADRGESKAKAPGPPPVPFEVSSSVEGLACNPMTIAAQDESEAWREFCAANGLDGEDDRRSIRRLDEGPTVHG